MDKRYSVLMSVYKKERPEYLHAALKSMTGQSWRPSEIVLVCDGPLTTELEAVLKDAEFHSLLKNGKAGEKCRPWSSPGERTAGVQLRMGGTYGQR